MRPRPSRPAPAGVRASWPSTRRWRRAPRAGNRSPPGRCASARCGAARPASPISSRQPRLDIHVDVLERAREGELARSSISARSRSRPATICVASSAEMMPCRRACAAWALGAGDILRRQSALSKPIEALISSMMASGPSANRPPHIVFVTCPPRGAPRWPKGEEPVWIARIGAAAIAVAAQLLRRYT